MFHRHAPMPTPAKHIGYLIAAMILGVLLGVLIHAGIELIYLYWAATHDKNIVWHGGCSLSWIIQIILPILGVIGGYTLGRWWWRVIYIEQRWLKRK
ncbi:MAG: hypothetical protein WC734_01585 [Patescibacteria group bacterium]|jgi:hypothetical protein